MPVVEWLALPKPGCGGAGDQQEDKEPRCNTAATAASSRLSFGGGRAAGLRRDDAPPAHEDRRRHLVDLGLLRLRRRLGARRCLTGQGAQ